MLSEEDAARMIDDGVSSISGSGKHKADRVHISSPLSLRSSAKQRNWFGKLVLSSSSVLNYAAELPYTICSAASSPILPLPADSDTEGREEKNALSREPKTLFEEPSQGGKFSIWNCVLFQDTPGALQGPMPPSSERHAQLRSIATEHSTWTVILSSGGHFAAGIFDMRSGADKCPLIRAVNVSRTGEWPVALEHKTVHR